MSEEIEDDDREIYKIFSRTVSVETFHDCMIYSLFEPDNICSQTFLLWLRKQFKRNPDKRAICCFPDCARGIDLSSPDKMCGWGMIICAPTELEDGAWSMVMAVCSEHFPTVDQAKAVELLTIGLNDSAKSNADVEISVMMYPLDDEETTK